MEQTKYTEVSTIINDEEKCQTIQQKKVSSKYFLRQMFISSEVWMSYFITGLLIGSPTVIIPQFRRGANSTDYVSTEMASWLSSAIIYSSLPWVIILSILTGRYGRRKPILFANTLSLIGNIVFCTAETPTQYLISLCILGILAACQITISIVIIPEYASSENRAWFLPIKSACAAWGIWVSNAIGTFFYWKWIPILATVCNVYIVVSIFFWPESPIWLASKGYFDKCAKSHKWLRGSDEISNFELESLLKKQKEYLTDCKENLLTSNHYKSFFQEISKKEYYKPIFLSLTAITLYHCSGKYVCCIYALDIIKKISDNESTAYTGMLFLDGVTVTGMYIGCALSKRFNRRTLLLSFSCSGIFFLYSLFLYLYLIHLGVILENKYLSIILLAAFSVCVSCGPLIIVATIYAEITPMRNRSFTVLLYGLYYQLYFGTFLKVAPYMFATFKLFGTFLFYAVTSSVFTLILYLYLPETKGKTIEEIQECMKKKSIK